MQNLIMMVLRGTAIGAIISAPMGPVGILCVQRTLNGGRRHGFYTGIGAAVSDLIYCLLTGFGLSFIEGFLQENQQVIQILGSIVLIGFGIYIMRKNPARSLAPPPVTAARKSKDVLSGFLFTFSNPLILFLIIGLFARFNFQSPDHYWYHYVIGYLSIVAGAVGWWWLITFAVNKVRTHFNMRSMWIINRIIGIIILIFALYGIISAFIPDANAEMRPAERLTDRQMTLSSPEPLPALITAPGHEAGRFSFIRSLPPDRLVTGLDFVLTNNRRTPGKTYFHTDSGGKKQKVRNPGISLVWKTDDSSEGRLRMHSAESARYDAEEAGGETRLIYEQGVSPKKAVAGLLDKTLFRVDIKPDRLDLTIGSESAISFPLRGEVISFDIEVEPGGEAVLEEGLIWTSLRPQFNPRVSSLDWSTPAAREESLHTLTENRPIPAVCGTWRLYQSSTDDAVMRRGGDYEILVLPGERPDGSLDIWLLGGAVTLSDLWPCGRLKGRLKPLAGNDWALDWLDTEGKSCGPAVRAHLNAGALTLYFPHHKATATFIRF